MFNYIYNHYYYNISYTPSHNNYYMISIDYLSDNICSIPLFYRF